MEKTIVTRTNYMQNLMTSTYPMIAIEAIKGGFDGSWERLIAERLKIDVKKMYPEAMDIVLSIYDPEGEEKESVTFMKAAYLITSSKIPECHI